MNVSFHIDRGCSSADVHIRRRRRRRRRCYYRQHGCQTAECSLLKPRESRESLSLFLVPHVSCVPPGCRSSVGDISRCYISQDCGDKNRILIQTKMFSNTNRIVPPSEPDQNTIAAFRSTCLLLNSVDIYCGDSVGDDCWWRLIRRI